MSPKMNVKQQYLDKSNGKKVVCASVDIQLRYSWANNPPDTLQTDYTEAELQHFLDRIDFEYDDGSTNNPFYADIFYDDGTKDVYVYKVWNNQHYTEIPRDLIKPVVKPK